jgi:hypothetical protein
MKNQIVALRAAEDRRSVGILAMIELGRDSNGKPVCLDIERLVSTRMLLQANSGGLSFCCLAGYPGTQLN